MKHSENKLHTFERLCRLGVHDLPVERPARIVSGFNVLEQILNTEVGVDAGLED